MENQVGPAQVLEFAMQVGKLLLENGAEIFRVEETMERICKAYGIENEEEFVLSNGIFLTMERPGQTFAKVKHIPVGSTRLDMICELNALSRDIESKHLDFSQAKKRLESIQNKPPKPFWMRLLAAAVGSGAFCVFFGGSLMDGAGAFVCGMSLYLLLLLFLEKHTFSKIVVNLLGGLWIALFCSALTYISPDFSVHSMIIGSIMPLIPGVAFCNSMREMADEDYISGSVRLLDVLLVFISVAIGVGIGLSVFSGGGA